MRGPIRTIALLALAGSALVAALLYWWPGGLVLEVSEVKTGRAVLVLPLEPNQRFTLRYFHSVNNLPIWEEHSVDSAGRIFIEEERFVSFNAGMGHWPGHGRHRDQGGLQVLEDIHEPTGDFVLRVGSPGVATTIIWRGTESNLSARYAGQALLVSARPVSLGEKLWRTVAPHPATPLKPGAQP